MLEIPRSAFRPPPEVSSALVTLRLPGDRAKWPGINDAAFLDFVKLCFSQKRKTLVNNLKLRAKPELIKATRKRRIAIHAGDVVNLTFPRG